MPWVQIYLWGAVIVFALVFVAVSLGSATEYRENRQQGKSDDIDVVGWTLPIPKNKRFAFLIFWGLETVGNLIFGIIMGIIWPIVLSVVLCCVMFYL